MTETSLAKSEYTLPARPTRAVAAWSDMIESFLDSQRSQSTRDTYEPVLRRLPFEIGGTGPAEVSPRAAQEWTWSVVAQVETGKLAPTTAERIVMTVRSFFKYAYILGQSAIDTDVRAEVFKVRRGAVQKPFVTLTEREERKLLRSVKGQARQMVAVMLYAGLRVSELCALRQSDYFESDGKLWLRVRYGKGGKSRDVPVGAKLKRSLGKPQSGTGPLFESRQTDGNGLKFYTRQRLWQIIKEAVGDKQVSPHSLRHTAAMRWLRDDVPLTIIQGWLGHSSLDTTKKYLDHTDAKAAHDFMK